MGDAGCSLSRSFDSRSHRSTPVPHHHRQSGKLEVDTTFHTKRSAEKSFMEAELQRRALMKGQTPS